MEKVILKATVRTKTGKAAAKDLRSRSMVPVNVYKGGEAAQSLQVSIDDLRETLETSAGENVIITLKISGEGSPKDKTVLIKEIQREPIKDGILHVDFNEISLTETLEVDVPLSVKGEAVGVKVDGGILEHVMWELKVECLPTDIPEKIEVDVSNLKIGDALHVKDMAVPKSVKVLNDPELIVLIVKAQKVEAPKEEAVEAAAGEPELIRKKKEEAEEEGAQATKEPAKEEPKKG
jgi:large subunit ribosomal protein L25